MNLEEKKNKLLEKYGELFKERTGYTGVQLDAYATELIKNGEQYYGSNFTEDILREKRNDSILWLMDQVTITTLPSRGSQTINEEEANNFQAWAQSLVTDYKMTPAQANEYASNPSNRFMYERWLLNKQSQKEPTTSNVELQPNIDEPVSKTQILLDKHGDLIKKRIFGGHFQGELNAVQEEQLKEKIDVLIENGKLHYGDNFLDELINNNSKENVAKILRSISLTYDKQQDELETIQIENRMQGHATTVPVQTAEDALEPQTVDVKVPEVDNVVPTSNQETVAENKERLALPPGQEEQIEIEENDNTRPMVPATAKLGKRKDANPKLIDKFKTYWKEASFKKKLLIGAVALGAVAGIAVVTATAISNMLATQSFDTNQVMTASNMISDALNNMGFTTTINNVDPSVTNGVDPNAVVDWSGITEGTEVYTTMDNASEATNALTGNEWMQVDHMEAVDQSGNVINLDGMTNSEVIDTLDSGDYQIRGSHNGEYQGWFTEDTVKETINHGRSL
ncbi:MAG: hypothetical protein HFH46_03465 [Bacilli bacterium]|nr:hypothetical protein [Bacilli bacterium]